MYVDAKKNVLSCLGCVWKREQVLAKGFCSVPSVNSGANRYPGVSAGLTKGSTSPEAAQGIVFIHTRSSIWGKTKVPECVRSF